MLSIAVCTEISSLRLVLSTTAQRGAVPFKGSSLTTTGVQLLLSAGGIDTSALTTGHAEGGDDVFSRKLKAKGDDQPNGSSRNK